MDNGPMWVNNPNFDNSHHAQLDVDIQNRKNEGTKHQYRVIHLKVYMLALRYWADKSDQTY